MSMSILNPEEIGGLPPDITDVDGQSETMLALADMSNTLNVLWATNLLSWAAILIGLQARGLYDIG
jgi:hypothetical protein